MAAALGDIIHVREESPKYRHFHTQMYIKPTEQRVNRHCKALPKILWLCEWAKGEMKSGVEKGEWGWNSALPGLDWCVRCASFGSLERNDWPHLD